MNANGAFYRKEHSDRKDGRGWRHGSKRDANCTNEHELGRGVLTAKYTKYAKYGGGFLTGKPRVAGSH